MSNFASQVIPPDRLSPPAPALPNASASKFLSMIPQHLRGKENPETPHCAGADEVERTTSSTITVDELMPRPQPIRLEPEPSWKDIQPLAVPSPTIHMKRRSVSVVERAEAIVTAAEDCGRLHNERAKKLYEFLVIAAITQHVTLRPELNVTPSRLTFFFVANELPMLLGVSRATIYRAFDDLKAGGLVAHRPWFTSSSLKKGGTVAGGVVADVVLSPAQGTEARVRAEYLRQKYRNLDADRHSGRTAWKQMTHVKETKAQAQALEDQANSMVLDVSTVRQINGLKAQAKELRQSISFNDTKKQLDHLLRWTLSPTYSNPVTLTVSNRQDAVYRLADLSSNVTPEKRREMIQERAQALCSAVGDQAHNINFWRWLLWRTVELDYTQPGFLSALMSSLLRFMTDLREWAEDQQATRPLKRPVGLFISRLKESGWWELLKATEAV